MARQVLRVVLKYAQGGQPVIRELQRVSTPGPAQVRRRRRDPARAQRARHGDPQHVEGADVRPRGAQARTGGELLALVW